MKKAILITMIICLVLVIVNCGCTEQNSSANTVTLVMHEKMFDFSTGQIITEEMTTEDIDVITGADSGKARLIACNDAEIKVSGDEEYSYYIDVSVETVCQLKDGHGGIATFTVKEISQNSEGFPTVKITWSYSS